MDIKVAFKSITDKVGQVLFEQGYAREKVNAGENEMVALFTSDTMAYSVAYLKDKKHMTMRSCAMTEDGPDNEWKILATWMFDPEEDTQKEADSIANDFVENCSDKNAIKRAKNARKKKKKNSDDGNADPLFLAKRFVSFFPELKAEIKKEEDDHYPFRGVTFTKESIMPRVNEMIIRGSKQDIEKLGQLLSTQYANGDFDTRSIITIVILNNTPEDRFEEVYASLSEDLQKAWKFALKFKGKKVKPEKVKAKKTSMIERLQAQQ